MNIERGLSSSELALNPFTQLFLVIWGFFLPVVIFFLTMFCSVVTVVASFFCSRKVVDWLIGQLWANSVLKICNVDVEVKGADTLPDGKGFLYLFNHVSFFDIFVMFAYMPRSFRFGAKIELFKIPFFGAAMRRVGILPIDRKNPSLVFKVYEEAQKRVVHGECFALAPEGTRQKTDNLGSFRKGPFIFALHAKMNILPVVMSGALDFMSNKYPFINASPWTKRKIILQLLPPIDTSQFKDNETLKLLNHTREIFQPVHDQLRQEIADQPCQRIF